MNIVVSSEVLDNYLTDVKNKKTNLIIFLMNGFQMRGTIDTFDDMAIIIDSEGKKPLVFKHAISTIRPLDGASSASCYLCCQVIFYIGRLSETALSYSDLINQWLYSWLLFGKQNW